MSTEQPPPPQPDQDVDMPPAPPLPSSAPKQQQPPEQSDSDPAPPPTSSDPIPSDQPPEQPSSSEPILPGPRAQRLRALFQQTTSHTLDKLSPANFRECFPTIAKKAPGTLDNVHRQMMERLSTLWNREFERILETRQVVLKLNELEVLIQEAQQKRKSAGRGKGGKGEEVPIPPHTLDAEVVLQAHLRGYLKEQQQALGGRLGEVQGENKRLFEEVLAQRKEMEGLIGGVEKIVGDVRGASEVLGGVVGELEEETRVVDQELAKVGGGVGA